MEIPGAIAGSERFFSRLGNVVTKTRSSLEGIFAGLVVLHSMRAQQKVNASKAIIIPNFGHLGAKAVNIQEWDEDEDDDDYDDNDDDDESNSDDDDDNDYDDEADDVLADELMNDTTDAT